MKSLFMVFSLVYSPSFCSAPELISKTEKIKILISCTEKTQFVQTKFSQLGLLTLQSSPSWPGPSSSTTSTTTGSSTCMRWPPSWPRSTASRESSLVSRAPQIAVGMRIWTSDRDHSSLFRCWFRRPKSSPSAVLTKWCFFSIEQGFD